MKRQLLTSILLLLTSYSLFAEHNYATDIEDARRGNKIAQYNIGYYYHSGTGGVSRDYQKAAQWYQKSADQGYASAQLNLGALYSDGSGVPQNQAKAAELYRKAAEQGNGAAQYNLGLCYSNGKGVTRDYTAAAYWYRKAVDQGHAAAQNNLGNLYSNGRGVEKNQQKAVELYRKAANQGDPVAQFNLANRYENGSSVTKDANQAYRLYKKSAEQGYAHAQYRLGLCYEDGIGVAKSDYSATQWYLKAAEQGFVRAQANVGSAYYLGTGVAKDFDKAVRWLRKARDGMNKQKEYEEALKAAKATDEYEDDWLMLAMLYDYDDWLDGLAYDEEDELDEINPDERYSTWRYNQVIRHLYGASYELGNCYYTGTGGKKQNYKTAVDWFRDAANHDNGDARYALGRCYQLGHGVGKNINTALEWYHKAADDNYNKDARYALGLCYKNGNGVAGDAEKAERYFRRAAKQEHLDACYETGLYDESASRGEEAAEWYLKIIEKGDAVQKAKAEKRLEVLAAAWANHSGTGSSQAYEYISHGDIHLKANNAAENVYTKSISERDFTYRSQGGWEGVKVRVGTYVVKRTRERWEDRYDTIQVKHPSTSLTLPPMLPKTGWLSVTSRPSKANVYVDYKNVGVTPWRGELQIGEHSVWLGKSGREPSETRTLNVPYKRETNSHFKLKSTWIYGSDDHPDHYLEPTYGIEFKQPYGGVNHFVGLRYGWIPKRFGLDVAAMYGISTQELSATIGPTFRLTNFSCPLSLQLALGGGAMYRFPDNYVTWAADAALRFGFREGSKLHKFAWWSFSLGARYYDNRFVPNISLSLMPVRAFSLAAIALEDFPCIYTELQAGFDFPSGQWMMGGQFAYIPGHFGFGTSFMVGFEGGWDVTGGPVFRLTTDATIFDLQVYQGFGYGGYYYQSFIAETSMRFAFGRRLPYWGLWSFNIGCLYGPEAKAITFGVSLPLVSIIGTAGLATIFYVL